MRKRMMIENKDQNQKQFTYDYNGEMIPVQPVRSRSIASWHVTVNCHLKDDTNTDKNKKNKFQKINKNNQNPTRFSTNLIDLPGTKKQFYDQPVIWDQFQPQPGVTVITDDNRKYNTAQSHNLRIQPIKSEYNKFYEQQNNQYLHKIQKSNEIQDIYEVKKQEISILSHQSIVQPTNQDKSVSLLQNTQILKDEKKKDHIEVKQQAYEYLRDIIPIKEFKKQITSQKSKNFSKNRSHSVFQDPVDKFNTKLIISKENIVKSNTFNIEKNAIQIIKIPQHI